MLTDELLLELENQFDNTPDYVIGVSYGFKKKNGQKTNQKSIIYKVVKKKPITEIPQNELIPQKLIVNGQEYMTDVVEGTKSKFLNCFASEADPSIQRLRGVPNLLAPMRGGNEIVRMPDGWTGPELTNSDYIVGTLGFFAVDNYDSKVVGITNSHVACVHRIFCNERDIESENPEPYNSYDPRPWENILPTTKIAPSCAAWNGSNLTDASINIKRYMPVTLMGRNYVDCALLIMNSGNVPATANAFVDSTSYQVWQPIGEPDYTTHMPFATTQELNSLLSSNPNLYSTGRTTGPKGWSPVSSCILRVTEVGVNEFISGEEGDTYWSDIIKMQYEDGVGLPARSGDSGSVVIADFSGTRKIVGLLFAGNEAESYGLFCRIDRVAETMNIRAWDASYVLNKTYPTATELIATQEANLGGTPNIVQNGKHFWQSGFRWITTVDPPNTAPVPVSGSSTGATYCVNQGLAIISDCLTVCSLKQPNDNSFTSSIKFMGYSFNLIPNAQNYYNFPSNHCNINFPRAVFPNQYGTMSIRTLNTAAGQNLVIYEPRPTTSDPFILGYANNVDLVLYSPQGDSFLDLKFQTQINVNGPLQSVLLTPLNASTYCTNKFTITSPDRIAKNSFDAAAIGLRISSANPFSTIVLSAVVGNGSMGSQGIAFCYCSESLNRTGFPIGGLPALVESSPTTFEQPLNINPNISFSQPQSKQKLIPTGDSRTKLCQHASKMPLEVIDSFHGKTAIRRCDIYGFCSHSIKIPDRPEVYSCQECPNYYTDENIPEDLLIFTEKNREEAIQVMNINNNPMVIEPLYQEVKYKKIDDFLKEDKNKTIEVEYKDLTEISEQNLKDMNGMKIKPIDNIKPNVDELLGE